MPITDDIMDHDLLGPLIRRGMATGGRNIIRLVIEKRFGTVPAWVQQRLDAMSWPEVEETADRVLDALSLEEIFGK